MSSSISDSDESGESESASIAGVGVWALNVTFAGFGEGRSGGVGVVFRSDIFNVPWVFNGSSSQARSEGNRSDVEARSE